MDVNLALLGRIAGPIAHDLHRYLSTLDACVAVLERRVIHEPAQIVLLHARGAIDGALRLTGALLDQAGGDVLPAMEVDLGAAVRRVLALFGRLVPPAVSVAIVVDEPAMVTAGRAALDRMILALLLDACDAMPEGGHLEIAVRAPPDEPVALEVSHTAAGGDRRRRAAVSFAAAV